MTRPTTFMHLAFSGFLALSTLFAHQVRAADLDLSPEQKDRVRAEKVEEAAKLISPSFKFVTPDTFTVAITADLLPFGAYASDGTTLVGSEPDLAQLIADSLGLKLKIVPVAWPDWPIGVISGRFDAAISNITVTEERKEKYDFSTYRNDLLGFYVAKDSKIKEISKPEDVAGLKVAVASGTNQEQILLRWIEANKAKGLADTQVLYFDDVAVLDVALQSGRIDAYFGPNATSAVKAAQNGKTRLVGTFSGGWPQVAEIAVTTKKGAGLADAITLALNTQIKNGNYAKSLARWSLSAEAIKESRTNPPGLAKK